MDILFTIFDYFKKQYIWYTEKFLRVPSNFIEMNYFTPEISFSYPKLVYLINDSNESLNVTDYIHVYNLHRNNLDFHFIEKLFNFKTDKISLLHQDNTLETIEKIC